MILERAFDIMKDGRIGRCNIEIPKGNCNCCLFDVGSKDNWIGLLPGEKEVLDRGDTSDWEYIKNKETGTDGIVCGRLRKAINAGEFLNCNHKSLECLMYPYFPTDVKEHGDGYIVTCKAAFPKCPLNQYVELFQEETYSLETLDMSDDMQHHLWIVSKAGAWMFSQGMDNLGLGFYFKGYTKEYQVYVRSVDLE